jgi:type IV secretion system protein VirB4
MLSLKGFRSKAKGLPDLLPYAVLAAPGVVLNKDGSFLAAWEFEGRDTASSTEEELDYVAEQVNQALLQLGNGWMLHVDAVRRPATSYPREDQSFFPDLATKMIDDERRAFFEGAECFVTTTILIATFNPFGAGLSAGFLGSRAGLDKLLTEFQTRADHLEAALSGVLRMSRLEEYQMEDEFGQTNLFSTVLSHIEDCITGEFRPVAVPPIPMYLDALLGSQDLVGGLAPRMGGKHIAVLAIDGFPQASWPAMLEVLSGLPLSYRYSTRYISLDQRDAVNAVDEYRKVWQQMIFRFVDKYFDNPNAKANRDAAAMTEDAEQAKTEAQGGLLSFGYLTSTIILRHEDEEFLHKEVQYVGRALNNLTGFGWRLETYNAVQAFLGSLPGLAYANVRRPLMSTKNLAHLLPLAGVWPGAAECPCPFYPPESPPLMICTTGGSTPFRLNLHEGDLGHTLIFGPTGAGKSTLLASIAAQFRRYRDAQLFVFDKGMSMFPLCLAAGGRHYDVGEEGALAFAPLDRIGESDAELSWACEWVVNLLELQGIKVLPNHQNAVYLAMRRLSHNPPGHRSLTDFYNVLQDLGLKEALQHYTGKGAMGWLLDAEQDTLGLEKFLVFEIEELMNLGEKNLIPVLLYLFHRIEKSLAGQPTLLILDEAWIMLGHPVFRAKIREWLKVLRKANCAVVLATQSLSDAARSEIMDVLAESCPTKIFLPNLEARNETQRDQYLKLGLNTRQLEIIARATPKRDYYVVSPSGRRQMQLALGRKALAFVGASGKEDIARIKELHRQYGPEWVHHWLAARHAA